VYLRLLARWSIGRELTVGFNDMQLRFERTGKRSQYSGSHGGEADLRPSIVPMFVIAMQPLRR
jgi:hypothetical protein